MNNAEKLQEACTQIHAAIEIVRVQAIVTMDHDLSDALSFLNGARAFINQVRKDLEDLDMIHRDEEWEEQKRAMIEEIKRAVANYDPRGPRHKK